MSLNVQACASLDTFADEIVESSVARVFARSAFGYGHDSDAAIVVDAAALLGATAPRRPHPSLLALPPQDATSKPPARSRTTLNVRRPIKLFLISFNSSRMCLQPAEQVA